MSLTKCPECARDVSSEAPACPHCGKPMAAATVSCQACGVPLVQVQRSKKWSATVIVTGPLFIIGLIGMLFNFVIGLGIAAAAAVIDYAMRGKETVMMCPKCGRAGARLD